MKTGALTKCALMTALLCIISPFTIPLGAVPLSLATFGVYLAAIILKPSYAVLSVMGYILLGALGLPVFSGFTGGISVLPGPTGGFIAGYALCAVVSSVVVNKTCGGRGWCFIGMLAGTVIVYLTGAGWFSFVTGNSDVWKICILPFIPADLLKIIIVTVIFPKLQKIK